MSSSGSARRRSTSRGRPSSAKKAEKSSSGTPKRASSRSATRVSSLATQNDVAPASASRSRRRRESSADDSPIKHNTRAARKKQQSSSSGFSFAFNSETATSVGACAFLLFFAQAVVYSVFFDEAKEDAIRVLGCLFSKSVGEDIISTIGKFYLHLLLPLPIYYFSTLILIGDPKKADDSAKALSRMVQFSVSLICLMFAFATEGGDSDYFEDDVSRAFTFLGLVASINEFLLYFSSYTTAKQIHFASVILVNSLFVFNQSEFGKDYFEAFLLSHALCLATSQVSGLVKNAFTYFEDDKPSFMVHMIPYVLGLFTIAIILFGEFTSSVPLFAYVYAVVYIGFHAKDTNAFKEDTQ